MWTIHSANLNTTLSKIISCFGSKKKINKSKIGNINLKHIIESIWLKWSGWYWCNFLTWFLVFFQMDDFVARSLFALAATTTQQAKSSTLSSPSLSSSSSSSSSAFAAVFLLLLACLSFLSSFSSKRSSQASEASSAWSSDATGYTTAAETTTNAI